MVAGEPVDIATLASLPARATHRRLPRGPPLVGRRRSRRARPGHDTRGTPRRGTRAPTTRERRRSDRAPLTRGRRRRRVHRDRGARAGAAKSARRFDLLERWRSFVPPDLVERPEVLLLDGIRRRLETPFAAETADLLRRAHTGLCERGETGPEITAIAELAFVLRSRGEMEEFGGLVQRILDLRRDRQHRRRRLHPFRRSRSSPSNRTTTRACSRTSLRSLQTCSPTRGGRWSKSFVATRW